jgi:protein phosphatase PTC6
MPVTDIIVRPLSPSHQLGWKSTDSFLELLSTFIRETKPHRHVSRVQSISTRREFHDYFVTHLPSSSLHPDSRSTTGLAHKFPRSESTPHTPTGKPSSAAPAAHPSVLRDTTVVRIPLKSAKHHYGAFVSRGSRPYNEDSHQAGVIELPAFAKKPPKSVRAGMGAATESVGGDTASGDPQVFYFGVFDGHGGAECSDFLRERLHTYLENCAEEFNLKSSLQTDQNKQAEPVLLDARTTQQGKDALEKIETSNADTVAAGGRSFARSTNPPHPGDTPLIQHASRHSVQNLEKDLVRNWKELVGGYFRRFKPAYFSIYTGYQSQGEKSESLKASGKELSSGVAVEEVITYSFLKADLDFVSAQAAKENEMDDHTRAERPLNDGDILGAPGKLADHIGGRKTFKGGSTCSVALVSTPTPVPFWHPATSSSMLVAHVGDTRIIVCSTANGMAIPLTTNHHPSSPVEAARLRRYAATFVTDSFGEERISGLANTRAFGDMASKRIGVSAEPEIKRIELGAAEYSFMVLMSDGITGTLSDQEVADIVKEAKTPEQAAKDVVNFATEVSQDGDNATCMVVRMGGWERRQEGGHGSLGTKESREFKRQDAADPRNRRR